MAYHISWQTFDITSVTTVDDPVSSGSMAIESFIEIYGPLLVTLDGRDMSSFVDFFFERSPCNRSVLVFVDENARDDFREMAIDMELIPDMKDIMVGESVEEKAKREEAEEIKKEDEALRRKAVEKQRMLKVLKTSTETAHQKQAKMLMTAHKTSIELEKKLMTEPDPEKKTRLEKKIAKIARLLANKHHSY